MYKPKLLLVIVGFLTLSSFSFSTLSKSDRKSKNGKKAQKIESLHTEFNDGSETLLKKSVNYWEILDEYKSFSVAQAMIRHFDQEILGYVTPWNNHGYDIAKIFSAKFTMLSPVWLQLKPDESRGGIIIKGLHDIDQNWILTLKQLNKKIKIVPRIILEEWTYPNLKKLLTEKKLMETTSMELINLAKEKKFDGYVLELWSLLGGQMKTELTNFIKYIATSLHSLDLAFILVIPPPVYYGGQMGMFDRLDFENLVDHVTAFSLMSYDYSNSHRPGPNSPLPWLLQCIENLVPNPLNLNRKKLLMGINFYGNDYFKTSSKSIIGQDYISILRKHKPKFKFSNITGEHSFTYRSENEIEHHVYFPTLYSIQVRLQLAKESGIGIAIWEIGQGLDYFYDLL